MPNELIRYTDQFDDPNLPGVLTVSVTLKPVLCGTDISIVQGGIPEAIPLEMRYLGWQESLASWQRWWNLTSRAEAGGPGDDAGPAHVAIQKAPR